MFRDILKPYEGQTIGINYDEPTKTKSAVLEQAADEYFTVLIQDRNRREMRVFYPYRQIVSAYQAPGGSVRIGSVLSGSNVPIVIQVFHLVVYQGGIGFAISM